MKLCNVVRHAEDWHEIKFDETVFVTNAFGNEATVWVVSPKDFRAEADSKDLDTEMERVGRSLSTSEMDKLLGFLIEEHVDWMKK